MADYVVARGCIETNGKLVARAGERYAPKSETEAERLLKDGVLIAGAGKAPAPDEKPEPAPAPEEKPAAKGKPGRAKAAQK